MNSDNFSLSILFLCVLTPTVVDAHSPNCKHKLPEIAVQWTDNAAEQYAAKAEYFRPEVFSMFDPAFVQEHLLPMGEITSRNGRSTMQGSQLSDEIEQTITELRSGKRNLTYFTLIKDKEYHWKHFAGLIVLKSRNHPYVVKLFTENPATFLDAKAKGMQHAAMSRMSGGGNRYLAGFLRLKNLEQARQIASTVELPMVLDFPRKWYWLPTHNQTMTVMGRGFGSAKDDSYSMQLPSVYAIVADWIETDVPLSYMRTKHRVDILNICHKFNFEIDPNIKNYRIEKGTNKLVLIDTEHYRSLLALNANIPTNSYVTMHLYVAGHALGKGLGSAKPRKIALNKAVPATAVPELIPVR